MERVLELWAWGFISAVSVHSIMEAAIQDGLDHPQAQALAAIGSHGRWTQNCQRDLGRTFDVQDHLPPVYKVTAPCYNSKKKAFAKH